MHLRNVYLLGNTIVIQTKLPSYLSGAIRIADYGSRDLRVIGDNPQLFGHRLKQTYSLLLSGTRMYLKNVAYKLISK